MDGGWMYAESCVRARRGFVIFQEVQSVKVAVELVPETTRGREYAAKQPMQACTTTLSPKRHGDRDFFI